MSAAHLGLTWPESGLGVDRSESLFCREGLKHRPIPAPCSLRPAQVKNGLPVDESFAGWSGSFPLGDAVLVHARPPVAGSTSKFIEVTDAACQQLGYTREELLQMGSAEIEAPETSVAARKVREQVPTPQPESKFSEL